jgi:hypothetical protein
MGVDLSTKVGSAFGLHVLTIGCLLESKEFMIGKSGVQENIIGQIPRVLHPFS